MNKEQIIDEVYENYQKEMLWFGRLRLVGRNEIEEDNWLDDGVGEKSYRQLSKEEFINKCKTNSEFSKNWGLKIEERELSCEMRYNIWFNNNYETGMEKYFDPNKLPDFDNKYYEPTPTKLITITYKGTKIESYE